MRKLLIFLIYIFCTYSVPDGLTGLWIGIMLQPQQKLGKKNVALQKGDKASVWLTMTFLKLLFTYREYKVMLDR
jgi:hypothetical protein